VFAFGVGEDGVGPEAPGEVVGAGCGRFLCLLCGGSRSAGISCGVNQLGRGSRGGYAEDDECAEKDFGYRFHWASQVVREGFGFGCEGGGREREERRQQDAGGTKGAAIRQSQKCEREADG
jgi:hypothetical protein